MYVDHNKLPLPDILFGARTRRRLDRRRMLMIKWMHGETSLLDHNEWMHHESMNQTSPCHKKCTILFLRFDASNEMGCCSLLLWVKYRCLCESVCVCVRHGPRFSSIVVYKASYSWFKIQKRQMSQHLYMYVWLGTGNVAISKVDL